MAPRVQPGYAFSIICDLGFAVGLTTHITKQIGSFVWIATDIFDEEPTTADVAAIGSWRWPVWLPLGAMAHRKLVIPVGLVDIPAELRTYPVMRGGTGHHQWKRITITEAGTSQILPGTAHPSLPIDQIVNDVRLKEMSVTRWMPEVEW